MKWHGPDSFNSWLMCFVCWFIYAIMFGVSNLSGVLFVASISRFNVGRQQASFPYTFAPAVKNLSGPLVGYFGLKFGVRAVSAFGALIGAVAVGACFFAESITLVTYLYGVFFGVGFGLGVNLLPITINQYFDKHRGAASGISFSGKSMVSLMLPPIVEILLNNCGLSKTFLFLSGLIIICVPAALILRKPKFEIQRRDSSNQGQAETCSTISRTTKHVCTIKNVYNNSEKLPTRNYDTSTLSTLDKYASENYADLSHEEKLKRVFTQTLLSGYSDQTSYSETASNEEKSENRKEKKQENNQPQQNGTYNLSSDNVHYCASCKRVDMKDKNICSANVKCQKIDDYSQFSSNSRTSFYKQNNTSDAIPSELFQNYSYQSDVKDVHDSIFVKSTDAIYLTNIAFEYGDNQISNSRSLIQGNPNDQIHTSENIKNSPDYSLEKPKPFELSDVKMKTVSCEKSEYTTISQLRSFSVICDPMFVLIAVTNAIHTYAIVSMMAIIVDFSRDLHIQEYNQKYILMLISVGDVVGRLGLCWITDLGYMSTPAFTALCFAGQGIFSAAIVWCTDFISLATIVMLFCSLQASLVNVVPIIIAQFIEDDKQTIAIPTSHFLSGLLCLAISPLIGYFSDEIGAYDWIFYGITILSAASSVSWIFVSVKQKRVRKN